MAEVPHRPATRDLTFCFQKLAGERDALQRELEDLKKKSEGLRSRNKVLSSEAKTLRSQMGTLVEKGRHDDELIDALMVRPSRPGRALARSPAPNSEGAPTWPRNLRLSRGHPMGPSPKATPQDQEQLRGCQSTRASEPVRSKGERHGCGRRIRDHIPGYFSSRNGRDN